MSQFIQLYCVAFSNSIRPSYLSTQSMPSNIKLKTGSVRPSLCQCWQDPAINEFLSLLNYYEFRLSETSNNHNSVNITARVTKVVPRLRDQYGPAINVVKYEVNRFKDCILYCFRNMTILKLCHQEEGRNFAPFSSQTHRLRDMTA